MALEIYALKFKDNLVEKLHLNKKLINEYFTYPRNTQESGVKKTIIINKMLLKIIILIIYNKAIR